MADDLEGKRKEKRIQELNENLTNELGLWDLAEIDPQMVDQNGFLLDCWIFTIRDVLISRGVIEENDMLIAFKEKLLKTLTELRPKVLEAKQKAAMLVAKKDTDIIGPDGTKLN